MKLINHFNIFDPATRCDPIDDNANMQK